MRYGIWRTMTRCNIDWHETVPRGWDTALGLFLAWLAIEADHERALREDDWNVLHVLEGVWARAAPRLGWVGP